MEVSVIAIVKNEAECIDQFLEAIASQTYSQFELIIVDDGSTDGTVGKIEKFEDSRFQCLSVRSGQGVAVLRNVGGRKRKARISFLQTETVRLQGIG